MNSRMIGLMLILFGLLANEWLISLILELEFGPWRRATIFSVQVGIVACGLFMLIKKPRMLAPRKAEVFLALSSVVLTLVALEGGARLWLSFLATPDQYAKNEILSALPPEYINSVPHHYLNYIPTPNYRKGLTAHNSLGYRDREFSVKKPAGVFRIVAIGGSTTYTAAVEDNERTYPALLGRVLREQYGYRTVEVINGGIGGHSSFESLINLHFRILDLDPDLVIIYHGTNDVHPRLVPPSLYRGDNGGRRKQWRFPDVPLVDRIAFVRILSRAFGRSHQVGVSALVDAPTALYMRYFRPYEENSGLEDPMVLLDENPPIYFRRNLISMVAVALAHEVQPLLVTWAHTAYLNDYASTEHYERGFREGNEVVRQVAEEFGVPLFDFAAVMPTDRKYWADGRHVNEAGALKKAQLFAEFIRERGFVTLQDSGSR